MKSRREVFKQSKPCYKQPHSTIIHLEVAHRWSVLSYGHPIGSLGNPTVVRQDCSELYPTSNVSIRTALAFLVPPCFTAASAANRCRATTRMFGGVVSHRLLTMRHRGIYIGGWAWYKISKFTSPYSVSRSAYWRSGAKLGGERSTPSRLRLPFGLIIK